MFRPRGFFLFFCLCFSFFLHRANSSPSTYLAFSHSFAWLPSFWTSLYPWSFPIVKSSLQLYRSQVYIDGFIENGLRAASSSCQYHCRHPYPSRSRKLCSIRLFLFHRANAESPTFNWRGHRQRRFAAAAAKRPVQLQDLPVELHELILEYAFEDKGELLSTREHLLAPSRIGEG